MVNPASAREIAFSSRSRRKWRPTSMRRTVALPAAGSVIPRSAVVPCATSPESMRSDAPGRTFLRMVSPTGPSALPRGRFCASDRVSQRPQALSRHGVTQVHAASPRMPRVHDCAGVTSDLTRPS